MKENVIVIEQPQEARVLKKQRKRKAAIILGVVVICIISGLIYFRAKHNSGYKVCSENEIRADISFVRELFDLDSVDLIKDKYPKATTKNSKYGLRIDGTFCGAKGTYQLNVKDDGSIDRMVFERGKVDTETDSQILIDNLDSVLGEHSCIENAKEPHYNWINTEYWIMVSYVSQTDNGIWFYFD